MNQSIDLEKAESEAHNELILAHYLNYISQFGNYGSRPSFVFDDFDYFISKDGKINHLLETKHRKNPSTQFETVIVPLRKHLLARQIAPVIKLYFACGWTDKIGVINLAEEPDSIGNVERRDREVTREHAFYKLERFKIIKE